MAYVTGMQGDDPKYYRAISTPKHYAVHSGPEPTRHTADVKVSKHDELDTYLPAFRATVTEGKAGSVMCAYNSVNGQPACVNEFLLQDQLRGKWNFQGYVVSDCAAIVNIFRDHHFAKTQPEASALAIQRGMDNECLNYADIKDDRDYKPYLDAYNKGFLKESDIDTALIRLFTARMKLGMFDPPEMVPYAKIDEKELDSPAHRELARALANESMVLLKNDGTLPLKKSGIKIAVVSPARRPDPLSARQLQRQAHAYGFRAGRNQNGISRCTSHVLCRERNSCVMKAMLFRRRFSPLWKAAQGSPWNSPPEKCGGRNERSWRNGTVNNLDLKAEDIPQEAVRQISVAHRVDRLPHPNRNRRLHRRRASARRVRASRGRWQTAGPRLGRWR